METIYQDIAQRTGGNIYIGVVGPVRTGKSTLIKRIMETFVIPNISDPYRKERAQDELPQSGSGKTIMTSEPKFVPEEAVEISPDGTALGILPDDFVSFDTICISVDPGSTMMMYSDGMTEATDPDGNEFGQERLSEIFCKSCEESDETENIIDALMQKISDYETIQSDDRTVVLIRRGGRYNAQG